MAENELKNPIVRKVLKLSKKKGTTYTCLEIIYKGYKKQVFLENAENFIFDDLPLVDESAQF